VGGQLEVGFEADYSSTRRARLNTTALERSILRVACQFASSKP
jgi:hypothetical protein